MKFTETVAILLLVAFINLFMAVIVQSCHNFAHNIQ